MNIGIVGAGHIGNALTRRFRGAGYEVAIANATGPHSLAQLAEETGALATSLDEVARDKDIAVIAIRMSQVVNLPPGLLDDAAPGVAAVDTNNYYPRQRDGRIDELERGLTESVWVQRRLGRPVVKALHMVLAARLLDGGKPKGTAGRIAAAIAGDDAAAKAKVMTLVDQIGFDAVDAGSIEGSWRQQPGTPCYCREYGPADLRSALAAASPGRAAACRATAKSPGSYASPA